MTLSPAFLDELRARTTLSALVGQTVKLTRAGREFKARCPFHDEKTPSFWVNDQKGFYHCFGCAANGDAIKWLTEARGLGFMDAVRELADVARLDMPAYARNDPLSGHAQLHAALGDAAGYFMQQLHGDAVGAADARAYLRSRGFSTDTTNRYCIGYAPGQGDGLRKALATHGDPVLLAAGLLGQDERGAPFDRFRRRLMIPIRDARGRIISFGGRAIGAIQPKYLNGPETAVFDKSRTLFNLDRAAPASRRSGRIIVVEGYLDVLALDQAGIEEAVAPLGTALTEAQLQLLWRVAPTPLLCFDGDAAGGAAAVRAAQRAMPMIGAGRSLEIVSLPAGQDPDDLVRAGGAAAMERALAGAVSLSTFLWTAEAAAVPSATPEARAYLWVRAEAIIETIGDPVVRRLYRSDWRGRFDQLTRPRRYVEGGRRAGRTMAVNAAAGMHRLCTRLAIIALLRHPEQVHACLEPIASAAMDPDLGEIRDAIVAAGVAGGVTAETLADELAERGMDISRVVDGGRSLPALACLRPGPLGPAAVEQLRLLVNALADDGRRRAGHNIPLPEYPA